MKSYILYLALAVALAACAGGTIVEPRPVSTPARSASLEGRDKAASYGRGSYTISTEAELRAVAKDLKGVYYLQNDITLAADWTPLGDRSNPFVGQFYGNGHVIRGLSFDLRSLKIPAGFFGRVGKGAIVQALGVEVKKILGFNGIGALAGENLGTLSGYAVGAPVQGFQVIGGLVGENAGKVIGYTAVDVTGESSVGGLVGANEIGGVVMGYAVGAIGTGKADEQVWRGGEAFPSGVLKIEGSTTVGLGALAREDLEDLGTLSGYAGRTIGMGKADEQVWRGGEAFPSGVLKIEGSAVVDGRRGLGYAARLGGLPGFKVGKVTSGHSGGGLVGYNVGRVIGYARLDVVRSGSADPTFGLLVGNNYVYAVVGYHSGKPGESAFIGIDPKERIGLDGRSIVVSAATTPTDFRGFSFGDQLGQWTLAKGHWPAINMGAPIDQSQVTEP